MTSTAKFSSTIPSAYLCSALSSDLDNKLLNFLVHT